jgi:hypothetical protein
MNSEPTRDDIMDILEGRCLPEEIATPTMRIDELDLPGTWEFVGRMAEPALCAGWFRWRRVTL